MMAGNAAGNTVPLSDTQEVTRETGDLLTRKLWIPKALYAALPFFYMLSGIAALLATLYISDWFWVLPHYLLFSVACVHMGILVYRRRRLQRQP
jgi:Flp pilus assembly protein TadB